MKQEAEEIFQEERGGGPFQGEQTESVQPFFERRPYLSMLPDDDRIYEIAEDLMGPDFFLEGTQGRLRVGPTPWHGGENKGLRHVRINIYPDPLTKDTGCLRVIPGTHNTVSPDLFEVLRRANYSPDFRPFGLDASEVPCVPLEVEPGDIVIFTDYVLHSSFGGKPGRHQLAVSFQANPTTDAEIKVMVETYTSHTTAHPSESYINSERPRIRRMVARLVELGFEPLPF